MEAGEEKILLHHFNHEHPLCLRKTQREERCSGCMRYFTGGEVAYGCHNEDCGKKIVLHEECAEMPRQISHSMRPQHIMIQNERSYVEVCKACGSNMWTLAYYCTGSNCNFRLDLGCAGRKGVMYAVDEAGEKQMIQHPSHPAPHELRLLRRRHSFRCDACGTVEKAAINSSSYICSICRYWIHESCASLPITATYPHVHHHPLSLSFYLPQQYLKFQFKCDICNKDFRFQHWVYHCELCRYVVHIKCAVSTRSPSTTTINAADDEDVIQFPINDISQELIKPFVMRERGETIIPREDEITNGKYQFHNHHHQLSLISLQENDHNIDDDDDDLDHWGRSKSICDGCKTPILQKKHDSSSSSSPSSPNSYKYYSCGECNYFLHCACFHLPPELTSLPLGRHKNDHKLILKTWPKLEVMLPRCGVCCLETNGLFYACTECYFIADIKCVSLPDTIKHAAHSQPHHYLKLVTREENHRQFLCGACGLNISFFESSCYICDSCEFNLDIKCALQPAATKHRWDKHPLLLTYDANINHPSDFYCDICETEMNPKHWMYHCRECDHSFHPYCLKTTCGPCRNLKYEQQYIIINTTCHDPHHPLTYQLITTKKRCDLCRGEVYGWDGFQCASCNFVMCLRTCGQKYINDIRAIE